MVNSYDCHLTYLVNVNEIVILIKYAIKVFIVYKNFINNPKKTVILIVKQSV